MRRIFSMSVFALLALSTARADMINLASAPVGGAPSGFTFARTGNGGPGKWVVVADDSAEGGRAIEQSSTEKTDYRFPLAIYEPVVSKNVEVTLRFKPIEGAVDRAGGIAARLIDASNYYIVRANALEDNVRFYHVIRGRRTELKSASLRVTANEWHTLSLKAEGDRFRVMFDGKELYTVTDKTITRAGKVALWTKADSVTRFDRIEINPLP
jgi:hypothetical protein